MNEPTRILLVEDDARLAELVQEYLQARGFAVEVERDGGRAVDRILAERPDVVLLDLMLPGEDGISICRRVRPNFDGAIIMLTARGDEIDQVVGLEVGADDYIAKPVGPRLLLARIENLLRRRQTAPPMPVAAPEEMTVGALDLSRARREAQFEGALIDLTTAEFDLLWLLAEHVGQPIPRDELFRTLRGIEYDGLDRTIDVHVSNLRRKLTALGASDYIKTVRGIGYQLAAPAA